MLPIPNTIPRLKPNNPTSKKSSLSGSNGSESTFGSGASLGSGVGATVAVEEKTTFSFQDLLEEIAPSNSESTRDINFLWRDLPNLERDLIHSRSPQALEAYKEHIRLLITTILAKNTRYHTATTPIRGTTSRKEYPYVEFINNKLKLLAETITHPQNSAFTILKQMDNIKGFLLDIKL